MKSVLMIIAGVLLVAFCDAQIEVPVKWKFSAKKISTTEYEIHLAATMDDGWHIYSQSTPNGGPVPTLVSFVKNPLLSFQGEVKEVGNMEEMYEPSFRVNVKLYAETVDFVQVVKVKSNAKTNVAGSVQFMTCNDERCMPTQNQSFSISLNSASQNK